MLRRPMLIIIAALLISCKKDNGPGRIDNPLQVVEARDLGVLKAPPALVGRDGGQSALISGKIVWLFGDSFFNKKALTDYSIAPTHRHNQRLISHSPLPNQRMPTEFPTSLSPLHMKRSVSMTVPPAQPTESDCGQPASLQVMALTR